MRRTAVLVGLLFLTATVTFLVADALIVGVLVRADYTIGAPADTNALTAGALLAFVDGLAVVLGGGVLDGTVDAADSQLLVAGGILAFLLHRSKLIPQAIAALGARRVRLT